MVTVGLKPLLGRLDRACTRALEAAAGKCIARGHHEITVEHLLLALLDDATGDLAFVVSRFDVDPERLRRSLQAAVDDVPGAHAGKPVFSPLIIELIQDAWLLASIDQGLAAVRSGSLLLAAVASRPARYLTADHPELGKIRAEELRQHFSAIVQGSSEDLAPALAAGQAPAGERGGAEPSALARFASDFTAAARAGKIDPVFGRDREIRQTIDILGRRRKNNPIIVGEAGVGKTAIVEGLALRVAEGDVPELLRGVAIWGLDLGLLQAGAGVKGEFESRLKSVIEEVKAASTRIILFIDEAHMLIGAGSAAGSADAANLLKPALARGELRTIAATTWAEYKQYFEEDSALARRFQPVKIDEPSIDDAALMLRGLKARYEAAHGVTVRDDAIDAAVRLSARYITGRLLPDKAVDLLDTAASRVHIGQSAKPARVEDLERSIGALGREQEAIERDRRGGARIDAERLAATGRELGEARVALAAVTALWKEQQAAVERVLALRREPGGGLDLEGALAALARAQEGERMVRLEVDPDVMAQVVEDWTGVPVGRMIEDEAASVTALEARLGERIKGQEHAVAVVAAALRAAKMGLKDPGKPQVFLLVGPSGVGKTELGLAVADALFGGERFVVTINMSEYQDREMGVSGLIGAKPGYVGYGKGGALTEAVRQRPYSVVLLDEVEKAGQEVRNLFYQVFDKGELTDGTGRKIDFMNTVVLMTTNLGAEIIQERCADASQPSPAELHEALLPLLRQALHPAWLARTTVVPFYSLPTTALSAIAQIKLEGLGRRLRESHRVELSTAPEVVEAIAARCTDVATGARNIDFILAGSLLPAISAELLGDLAERAAGTRMVIGLDAEGDFTARLSRDTA
jgi:type VI secretion system protein VasG